MKSSSTIFLAAFVALSASWAGFVLVPQLQLGRVDQAKTVPAGEKYPLARAGMARQGAELYRSLGCAYCHSQQVFQDGARVDVFFLNAGTNADQVFEAIGRVNPDLARPETFTELPKKIAEFPDVEAADPLIVAVTEAGGKIEGEVVSTGSDMERGWGRRRTVAQDFVYNSVVQPGVRRMGPDLANVGNRLPDPKWHLLHLYTPQTAVKDSTMPPYRFLFEQRKIGRAPSPDALSLPEELSPPAGFEIVPTEEAKALAAYLVSLRSDVPLFESPVTPLPAPATNAVAAQ